LGNLGSIGNPFGLPFSLFPQNLNHQAKINPKGFKCLWQKHSYNYKEIMEPAQKYFNSCKANRTQPL